MKRIYAIVMILTLVAFTKSYGQDVWSLQQCINYAFENNIQIQKQVLETEYRQNDLDMARLNRLPNLNASISNSMSYGRSLTYDNTYSNINSNETGAYLGSEVTLWNGSVLKNTIKAAELDLKSSFEELQKAKDDIVLNIAASYLEILFAEELVTTAEDLLKITEQQIDRTNKLVEAGSLAKGSLLEIEAQHAREELALVNEQNNLQLKYLNLYQFLELPLSENFKIQKPVLPEIKSNESLLNSSDVFKNAAEIRPEIKYAEFQLEKTKVLVDQAKGNMLPSLSFGGQYYNSYNNKYTDTQGNNISLGDQLTGNERYGFGFSLSIPIFNQLQARKTVSNKEIQMLNQKLELQSAKNLLRKEIEQAYTNALAAFKRYLANQKTVVSSKEAFRYAEEKFNVGMINSVEYNQSKNNLAKAQSDFLQAKYEYIFRTKILDFYNGVAIEL